MSRQKILIDGTWREGGERRIIFAPVNPATGESLAEEYPVSAWADCDAALAAAAKAANVLRNSEPALLASFLNRFAGRIEARAAEIIDIANAETGLAKSPRLAGIELPRTVGQLRQAAAAAMEGSWALPTIDTKNRIRSCHAAIGPVCVFGPNNFPLAFNGASGGDFAAAIAAGNPVIIKGHPTHPGTTRLLAEEAFAAIGESELPTSGVQLIYHVGKPDGLRLVSDERIGATGFTGSRRAGLALKAAADAAGKPIYLEMSSLNPVVVLPGAIAERGEKIADEYADSCLAATGQFCTKPGLLILLAGQSTEEFLAKVRQRFADRPAGLLLSDGVAGSFSSSVEKLVGAGAEVVVGGKAIGGETCRFANTLLRVDGATFLSHHGALQTEAFGNAALVVVAQNVEEACKIVGKLEGQLTGCIYSNTSGVDDANYAACSLRSCGSAWGG